MPLREPEKWANVSLEAVIDDFEDGNLKVVDIAGRSGSWYSFPVASPTAAGEASTRCAARGTRAGHFVVTSGDNPTNWNATMVDPFTAVIPYNASAWGGFSFWIATGDPASDGTAMTVGINTPAVIAGQGFCTMCGDYHSTSITLTRSWTRWSIRFDESEAAGFRHAAGGAAAQGSAGELHLLAAESVRHLDRRLPVRAVAGLAAPVVRNAGAAVHQRPVRRFRRYHRCRWFRRYPWSRWRRPVARRAARPGRPAAPPVPVVPPVPARRAARPGSPCRAAGARRAASARRCRQCPSCRRCPSCRHRARRAAGARRAARARRAAGAGRAAAPSAGRAARSTGRAASPPAVPPVRRPRRQCRPRHPSRPRRQCLRFQSFRSCRRFQSFRSCPRYQSFRLGLRFQSFRLSRRSPGHRNRPCRQCLHPPVVAATRRANACNRHEPCQQQKERCFHCLHPGFSTNGV